MAIITRNSLAAAVQARAGAKGVRGLVSEARQYSRHLYTTSVFLSHSHSDREEVERVAALLRTLGVDVYVDWMDSTMSSSPDGTTAERLKEKIRTNDKFIFMATNSGVASKWCNWEVGIADTVKQINGQLALLPIADNSGHWTGNEYLQIYPRIEEANGDYYVITPAGSRQPLSLWLVR